MLATGRQLATVGLVPLLLAPAVLVYVSYEAADRLIHPPRDMDARTPASVGLAFEPFAATTLDAVPISGWWMPASHGAPTVIFLHGYGASKAQSLAAARFLHDAGYHVAAFDFRAHGASGGSHTTLGLDEVEDVRAVHAWVAGREEVDPARVALLGWSMGAAAAVRAAHELPVAALVLDSPFASIAGAASRAFTDRTGLPSEPVAPLSFRFAAWMTGRDVTADEPVRAARGVGVPILVIQGLRDAILASDGPEIRDAAEERAELWLVPGAAHVDALNAEPEEYEARVLSFLAISLASRTAASP